MYYNDFSSSISDFNIRGNTYLSNGLVNLCPNGRPYLYSKTEYKNVKVTTSGKMAGNGQLFLLARYDGNISSSYDTPLNAIFITAWADGGNEQYFVIRKNENGVETTIFRSTYGSVNETFFKMELSVIGENSNVNCIAKINDIIIYNGNFSYNPSNIKNYIGLSGREQQTAGSYYDYIRIEDLIDTSKYNSYLI